MTRHLTKIAVILPAAYGGGTLRGALNLVTQLHDGALAAGDRITVEFGYVQGSFAGYQSAFAALDHRRISYRTLVLKVRPTHDFLQLKSVVPMNGERLDSTIIIFDDGISNFDDADYRIIVSDRLLGGSVAPTSPYSIVAYDFIQRYVPEIFGAEGDPATPGHWRDLTGMMRNYIFADAIMVTSDQAASDAVAFAGARRAQVCKLPWSFDPVEVSSQQIRTRANPAERPADQDYLIWTTNVTPHKNHRVVLNALEALYSEDVAAPKTYVTGVMTENLDPERPVASIANTSYVHEIRKLVQSSEILKEKVVFKGELSDRDYVKLLSGATLLLHGAIFDNGTFAVVEAAWQGVPSVSSGYAPMREIGQAFKLPLVFFDARRPEDMVDKIRAALANIDTLRRSLPTRDDLRAFSTESTSLAVWQKVRGIINHSGDVIPCRK